MSNYTPKPHTIDLKKLTEQLVNDIQDFKDSHAIREVIYLTLLQVFQAGDKHGWWIEREKGIMEEPDPFDEDFLGGDREK